MTSQDVKFKYTATGVLGDKRETMLDNLLHMREQLGRSKTYCHKFSPGRTFGVTFEKGIGVPEAMAWPQAYKALIGSKSDLMTGRDFISMNREAVRNGLVSSREFSDFYATHNIMKKEKPVKKNEGGRSRAKQECMVYGISTRPSTPIHELIAHKYQNDWLDNLRKQQKELIEKERSKMARLNRPKDTRTSLLRMYMVPVEENKESEMGESTENTTKFINDNIKADPRISTFRTDLDKDVSLKYHVNNQVSGLA